MRAAQSMLVSVLPAVLAVLAVLLATMRRRPAGHLRGRSVPVRSASWASVTALVATGLVLVVVVAPGRSMGLPVLALVVITVVTLVGRGLLQGTRRRATRRRRRSEVIEMCDALVAELKAGLPVRRAVENACAPWPEFRPVVATARLGGDVAGAFSQASHRPGAAGLRLVAASWQVSGQAGAGLAVVLDRVATTLRSEEEAHTEVTAALGPPRATAKLLTGLPVVGLVLGTTMGVDPVGFLLGDVAGNVCLAIGLALALLGLGWVERLADAVES